MTMTDPVGDMLTRIRNGQRCGMPTVTCPASHYRANVLDALQREGYIRGFSWSEISKGIKEITIELQYSNGDPVIRELSRVSTPRRPACRITVCTARSPARSDRCRRSRR